MEGLKNSIKNHVLNHITRRGWTWIGILYLGAIMFYREFFSWPLAFVLGAYITLIIVTMLMIGYIRLGSKVTFPLWEFLMFVVVFSLLRFVYIRFFLSNHLPEYTLFHYPYRAIPATIVGTAILLFLGYSYAIYEWGLAAREKYTEVSESTEPASPLVRTSLSPPIMLRSSGKTIYLLPQDIVYLKANGEYVDYNTTHRKYTCFKRLKDVARELAPHGFVRTHRSYIINSQHVASLATSEVVTSSGVALPLSKTYRKEVQEVMEKQRE